MGTDGRGRHRRRYSGLIGDKILKYRAPIGILLLAITAYFGFGISKFTIGTSFVDFFPRNHPYVQLYHTYRRYGEAQTLALMLQVKWGDIYNPKTLEKIQDLTFDSLLATCCYSSVRPLTSLISCHLRIAIARQSGLEDPYVSESSHDAGRDR